MSTVGHPLSDVCNLLTSFYTARYPGAAPFDASGFLPGCVPGLPQPEQMLEWYGEAAGWEPSADEVKWGVAFNIWKLAGVCQGIAARYAVRQASNEKARHHGATRVALAEYAWEMIGGIGVGASGRRSRL